MNKRIPRPYGLTSLAKQQNKEQLINHTLNTYISNNYTWNNRQVSLKYMAQCLDITEKELYRRIALKVNKMTKLITPEAIQNIALDLNFMALKNLTEVRYGMLEQLNLLLSAQKGKYKPFISDTVLRAFDMISKHDKGYQEIARNLNPTRPLNQTNILNQTANVAKQDINNTTNVLSIHDAMSLIQEEVKPLQLEGPNNDYPEGLPEVRANFQGITTKDGIIDVKAKIKNED